MTKDEISKSIKIFEGAIKDGERAIELLTSQLEELDLQRTEISKDIADARARTRHWRDHLSALSDKGRASTVARGKQPKKQPYKQKRPTLSEAEESFLRLARGEGNQTRKPAGRNTIAVAEVLENSATGLRGVEIAEAIGLPQPTIGSILRTNYRYFTNYIDPNGCRRWMLREGVSFEDTATSSDEEDVIIDDTPMIDTETPEMGSQEPQEESADADLVPRKISQDDLTRWQQAVSPGNAPVPMLGGNTLVRVEDEEDS